MVIAVAVVDDDDIVVDAGTSAKAIPAANPRPARKAAVPPATLPNVASTSSTKDEEADRATLLPRPLDLLCAAGCGGAYPNASQEEAMSTARARVLVVVVIVIVIVIETGVGGCVSRWVGLGERSLERLAIESI